MDRIITAPILKALPFQSPVITLPELKDGQNLAASKVMALLLVGHTVATPRPDLVEIDPVVLQAPRPIIAHCARIDHDKATLLILPDRSALILHRKGARVFLLPFVFSIVKHLPFLAHESWTGISNMITDIRGTGDLDYGIYTEGKIESFLSIRATESLTYDKANMLRALDQSLRLEMLAWIKADRVCAKDRPWPVAICLVKGHEDNWWRISDWISKLSAHLAREIGMVQGQPLHVTLHKLRISQETGMPDLDIDTQVFGTIGEHDGRQALQHQIGTQLREMFAADGFPVKRHDLFERRPEFLGGTSRFHQVGNMQFKFEIFQVKPISAHERLDMERTFGLRETIAAHRNQAFSQT